MCDILWSCFHCKSDSEIISNESPSLERPKTPNRQAPTSTLFDNYNNYVEKTRPTIFTIDNCPKLELYNSTEDLKQLSVQQMKALLTINRVNYRGCIEKFELLEKVETLWQDFQNNKGIDSSVPSEQLCKICMDAPLNCVLLECGHIASCISCGKQLAECPICRQYVVRIVKTFKV